jgi:pimeloyl-ACP methyl ester carboxylesterase
MEFGYTARGMDKNRIRTKWESLQGRRVRLRVVLPANARWQDPLEHPPLLLIHGLAGSADAWEPMLHCLQQCALNRPVYGVDLPGFGHSQGPPYAPGMTELADWLARLLDLLGIARAHLAGVSMGCQVALALAHRHPGRVGALVLVAPTLGGRAVPLWRYILGMALNSPREPWRYKALATRMFFQMGPLRYAATVREMMSDDTLARAVQVTAPTLVVRGSADGLVPEASVRRLTATLPNGAFAAILGAGHVVQYHRAQNLARLVQAHCWGEAKPEVGQALWGRPDIPGKQ